MINEDHISILFCSYNGEKYLREQIDSIISQTHSNWTIYISDDGSSDSTLKIIEEYIKKLPKNKIYLLKGPSKGFAANFLSLLRNKDIHSPYYAFSDQDDIWFDTRLERALKLVKQAEQTTRDTCVLYGGRTKLIDAERRVIGLSPLFIRDFKLENALLQSYSGGNTMLFNHAIKNKIEMLPEKIPIVSHDWYLYLVCAAFSGEIIYDREPQVLYRQHGDNIVGSNLGLLSKLSRLKRLYNGEFAQWNNINKLSIEYFYPFLPKKQKEIIDHFNSCGDESIFIRFRGFLSAKVYRQKKSESLLFMLMNVLGKIN
ncbi:glycosyltransferase family 2 protein [Erwinia tasmaniensis]|uniref:glycosyltransferase family 2 protein n=1 Tax=Erwinia tasmaniensis TaxID=338565 RepID=UPI003A4D670D